MTGTDAASGESVPLELIEGNEVRELRCATLTAHDGTVRRVVIFDGMTPDEFRREVSGFGIEKFKTVDLSVAPEEIEWVESLVGSLTRDHRTKWIRSPVGPTFNRISQIKVTVSSRYFRCIAKIGFHYFLTKESRFRGDEPCFRDIRKFIVTDCAIDECRKFVAEGNQPLARQFETGGQLEEWGHVLCAEIDGTDLRSKVQLFAGPKVQPRLYTVNLGQNPSPILYFSASGNFFSYYPKPERREFDGEVSELLGTKMHVWW